jgi:hypothetical protein
MPSSVLSTEITDPVNARILAVSEDRIAGFHEDPFAEIARLSGLQTEIVLERLRAMLEAGVVRRIRQTLMATNLAPGALVAWQVPTERLDAAFDFLVAEDPFSGHVVIRSTDAETSGSVYRLWTTLKVPQGFSMQRHCELLAERIGAQAFRIMPAKCLFALGVATCDAAAWSRAAGRRSWRGARHQHRRPRRAGVARAGGTQARAGPRRGACRAVARARREAGVSYDEFLRVAGDCPSARSSDASPRSWST